MSVRFKQIFEVFLAAATLAMPLSAAFGEKYPDRPVRIILPLGAGGVGDISARIVAEKLGDKLGQRFVIENIPAAGGIAAAKAVSGANADGYTLILFTGGTAGSVPLYKVLPYNPLTEFTPISAMGYFDCLIVTNADSKYKSLADVLRAAKDNPGKLNLGTISTGGIQNLTANYFKQASGLDFTIVPFRTTPEAIVGVLRNDLDLLIDFYAALHGGLSDGKLRALAWSGAAPSPALPDVPSAQQQGVKGFAASSWNGFYAKAGTSPEIIATLNKAIRDVLDDSDVKKKLLDLGIESRASSPDELNKQMRDDIKIWTDVIAKAGIELR